MLFDASVTIITTSDFIKNDVKNTLMHCLSFVKMSVRVIKHKLIAILLIDSVISQRDSVISQRDSVISQRGSVISQRGSVISQHDFVISQHGFAISQHGFAISQHGSVISQRGTVISQRGFATSQHGFVRLRFRKRIVIIHEKIYQLKLI